MMKVIWMALMAATAIFGQTYFLGMGGGFYGASAPHATGYLTVGIPLDSSNKTYSYTTVEMRGSSADTTAYSTRTGIARKIVEQGRITLLTLATGGASVSGTATSGAFAGGGVFSLRPSNSPTSGFRIMFGVQALTAPVVGGWEPLITVGIGYRISQQ